MAPAGTRPRSCWRSPARSATSSGTRPTSAIYERCSRTRAPRLRGLPARHARLFLHLRRGGLSHLPPGLRRATADACSRIVRAIDGVVSAVGGRARSATSSWTRRWRWASAAARALGDGRAAARGTSPSWARSAGCVESQGADGIREHADEEILSARSSWLARHSRRPCVTALRDRQAAARDRHAHHLLHLQAGRATGSIRADHMRASIEMQLSGEPFAQLLGLQPRPASTARSTLTDQYIDPDDRPVTHRSARLRAGGRVLRVLEAADEQPELRIGRRAVAAVRAGPEPEQRHAAMPPTSSCAIGSSTFAAGEQRRRRCRHELDRLAGARQQPAQLLWLARLLAGVRRVHELRSRRIMPVRAASTPDVGWLGRSFGYGGGGLPARSCVGDYECDYNSLNLPNRDAQVDEGPRRRTRWATPLWKQGLWTINYWQTLQDIAGNAIIADRARPTCRTWASRATRWSASIPDPADPTRHRADRRRPRRVPGRHPDRGLAGARR